MKAQKNKNAVRTSQQQQQAQKNQAARQAHLRAGVNNLRCLIYWLICYLVILIIVLQAIVPKRYDNIEVGKIASTTILASKDIEDKAATEKLVEQAVNAVEPVYSRNEAVTSAVINGTNDALSAITSVRTQGRNVRNEWLAEDPERTEEEYTFQTTFIDTLISLLPFESSQDEVLLLINASDATVNQFSSSLLNGVTNALSQGFRAEQTEEKKGSVLSTLALLDSPALPSEFISIAGKVLTQNLQGNLEENAAATQVARNAAASAVEPVIYRKGTAIVTEGDTVTELQYGMLRELGLLSDEGFDWQLYGSVTGLLLLLLLLVAVYVRVFHKDLLQEPKKILLLCILMILIVLAAALILRAESRFVPFIFGTMLIAMLIGTRVAFVTNTVLSVVMGLLAAGSTGFFSLSSVPVILIGLTSGSAAVFLSQRPMHRMRIVITGLLAGAVGGLTSVLISMALSNDILQSLLGGLYPLGGGLISSVICIGTLPVWESLFDILTPTKLLELTNSDQPLLRRLALEAPGTHHHSIVVANLAELGAEAIGADTMLVRAGAYYHDIGKLTSPECYTENQDDKQKSFHALLTPEESAAIIRAHTTDGYELALKYKLPMRIRQIIREHHGTTMTGYFYAKALENDPDTDPANFTYPGPKPSSKEAAIIMIADSVEAAVRSLPDKSPANVREKIDRLIKDRLLSGQFDECDISMLELNRLAAEFTQALSAVHHDRIAYPELHPAAPENTPEIVTRTPEESADEQPAPAEEAPAEEAPAGETPAEEAPAEEPAAEPAELQEDFLMPEISEDPGYGN